MKAITILQPWASLIACGAKKIETRGWKTSYRGPIAIHAGKSWTIFTRNLTYRGPFYDALWKTNEERKLSPYERTELLPVGSVIAIADLVDCYYIVNHPGTNIDISKSIGIGAESMTLNKRDPDFGKYIVPTDQEIAFGDWTPGRYAWILDNIRQIEPVPAKGQQRIWEWDKQ